MDGFSEPRLGMGAHHTHPLHSIPRNSATPGTRLPGENSLVHCSWGHEVWSQKETFLNIILQRNTRMGEDNLFRTIVFPWFTSCPFPLATQQIQDLNQQALVQTHGFFGSRIPLKLGRFRIYLLSVMCQQTHPMFFARYDAQARSIPLICCQPLSPPRTVLSC